MSPYWDIRQLSAYLNIKASTLYAWAAQEKMPCVKVHGLIRFRRDEIEQWLETFRNQRPNTRGKPATNHKAFDIDRLIARAKRAVYTSGHGETRPRSSLIGKGERDGALEA